jgi:ligand-binding sensor domain-containing protein
MLRREPLYHRFRACVTSILLACLIVSSSAIRAGVAPTRGIGVAQPFAEWIHRTYTPRDGAPSEVTALAQTRDGFLWLGSPTGLVRFDGVDFDASVGKQLPSPNVYALFADGDDLWIGYTFGGISRLRHGQLVNYSMEGLPGGSILAFARRPDGVLWAADTQGLMRLVGQHWHAVGAETGFMGKHILWMAVTDGTLWVMDTSGAYFLAAGADRFHAAATREAQRARGRIPHDGEWGSMYRDNRSVLIDDTGALWIGAESGLERDRWRAGQHGPLVETLTPQDGLSGNMVGALLQDREGNVWVGTNRGLDQFRHAKFTSLALPGTIRSPAIASGEAGELWIGSTLQEPMRVDDNGITLMPSLGKDVWCVARDRHGAIWMASDVGLRKWVDGKVVTVPLPDELQRVKDPYALYGRYQAIATDAEGGVWLSVAQFDLYRLKDGIWKPRGGRNDLPAGPAIRLLADADERLWLTYPRNHIAMIEHGALTNYTAADGLAVGNVLAIYVRGAHVWVAGDLGVAHLEHGRFMTLAGVNGESFRATASVVETPAGELWLDSANGVYRIPADEVQRTRANPAHIVSFELFDSQDGLQSPSQQIRPGPNLRQGPDGRLWVARLNGVSWIDPQHIRRNRIAPIVSIESLHSSDVGYQLAAGLVLPELTRNLHFDYTAPSLSIPQRVHFRYQLLGVDSDWQDAGTRRQAFYTNLGPGSYRFRVQSANEDGVWSTRDATFDFRIAPAFYQTWWFDVLCLALALGMLWLLYLLRLRQLAARELIRTAERERIARDLHDTLLQGIQGLQLRVQTWAADKSLEPRRREEMDQVAMRTRKMLTDGRDRIIALRRTGTPEIQLVAALREIGEDYASMYPARFALHEEGEPRLLWPEVAAEVLDLAREGLRNAFVHAAASSIELAIAWRAAGLCVRVSDDGCGIDEAILRMGERAGHWGLPGMRERATRIGGRFDLRRRECGGTELSLWLPARGAFADVRMRLWRRLRRTWKAHTD